MKPLPHTALDTTQLAPVHDVSTGYHDTGDLFVVDAGTWDTVHAACLAGGGDLVSIHSAEQALQVAEACGHTHCYIGLQRADDASPFEWTDGSALSYAAWDAEQPQTGFDETKVLSFRSFRF